MANDLSRIHAAVLIDYAGDMGGAETLAAQLLERLDPERFQRTLVVYQQPASEGPELDAHVRVRDRLQRAGVEVLELNRRDRHDFRAWWPFVRLLRTGGVQILHSHKFGPNLWATSFARLLGTPVVVAHEHTWAFEGAPLRRFLDRWLIATGCDAFVAVSERDRERMERVERIPPGRIRFLPNGIPAPAVAVDGDEQAEVRRELGIPAEAPIVGTVGVFRRQKDLGSLVRAHRELLERVPDAHLVIVGDGAQKPEVERLVDECGTTQFVRMPGLRADAVRLAGTFDVAVNCSLFEGSALAVIEYMALGRPIVATAVGGTPDLLAQGAAGTLVPPSDPGALATAIGDLLEDPEQARALGERARTRQREEYDIDVQVQRLERLYDELLEGVGAGRRRRWLRRVRRGS